MINFSAIIKTRKMKAEVSYKNGPQAMIGLALDTPAQIIHTDVNLFSAEVFLFF